MKHISQQNVLIDSELGTQVKMNYGLSSLLHSHDTNLPVGAEEIATDAMLLFPKLIFHFGPCGLSPNDFINMHYFIFSLAKLIGRTLL